MSIIHCYNVSINHSNVRINIRIKHLNIRIKHLNIRIKHLNIRIKHLNIRIKHLNIRIKHLNVRIKHLNVRIKHLNIMYSIQLYLVNDPFPHVRAEAVRSLTHCLSRVKSVPISDANTFPEYILPQLVSDMY